jgi:hypothetical protein
MGVAHDGWEGISMMDSVKKFVANILGVLSCHNDKC